MNDLNKMHFDAFPKDAFEIFINCLETQGYVIDSKSEQGYSFSSTQLDNMTEEVFTKLIEKYDIYTEFNYEENFERTGLYHPAHGGYSIIYNSTIVNYREATIILNQYLDLL